MAASSTERAALYGRDREAEVLRALIAEGQSQGSAFVIRGEPGIGKSSLLSAAALSARAKGFQILAISGVESETELPFAGLHLLLRTLASRVESLPPHQREAVLAAFGRGGSAMPDLFLVAMATLDLLADAASDEPILILADDAHWLDPPTADVLTFVARRVESDPIVLLFAVRDGSDSPLLHAGLREMPVERLTDEAAEALLAAQGVSLVPSVRKRVLDAARGNPLALIELPTALMSEDLTQWPEPVTVLPLTTRLERAFGSRYVELPPKTRIALLVVALDDGASLAEVLAAAGLAYRGSVTVDDLTPAVNANLVDVDRAEIRFRHPLMRSAVSQSASLADRLASHAALARTLDDEPDRQAWHRASSIIGFSEEAASELEAVASRARARGAAIVSVTALERAAELSADPRRRLDRLLRAAEVAFEQGRRDLVARIVQKAEPLMSLEHEPLEQGRLTLVRGLGEPRVLDVDRLASLVDMAARARRAGDTNLAWNLLWRIAQRCFWADPGPEARQIVVTAAEEVGERVGDARQIAVLAYAAPLEQANLVIDRIARWPSRIEDAEAARLLGSAAVVVGAFEESMRFFATAVSGLRIEGRLAHLARALAMQGWSATCLANWKIAVPALDEAVRLAAETGEQVWGAGAQALRAILAAVHGEAEIAAGLALEAERAVITAGATHMLAYVQVARGLIALGEGRNAEAYDELHRIFDPGDPAHHRVPCCWYIGELAEAAARSGHAESARTLLAEYAALVENNASSWIQAGMAYARAQLASDANADTTFKEAIRAHASQWPFQRARLQLAYGSWLRRHRRVSEARTLLRSARGGFDVLGAPRWAERSRQELRAAGEASRKRTPGAWDQLSPQEMQIASMVAEGLSNREIAQRLFLSHRTVGSHLYRLFPKLGVASRSQLAAVLAKT